MYAVVIGRGDRIVAMVGVLAAAALVAVMGRWSDGYCDSVNWQTGVCWLEAEVVGRRSSGGRGGEGVNRFRCGQVSRPPRWWAAV